MHKVIYNTIIDQISSISESLNSVKVANIEINTSRTVKAFDDHEEYATATSQAIVGFYNMTSSLLMEIEENYIDYGEDLIERYTKVLNLKLQREFKQTVGTGLTQKYFEVYFPDITNENFREKIQQHALVLISEIRSIQNGVNIKRPSKLYWHEELAGFFVGVLFLVSDSISLKIKELAPAATETPDYNGLSAEKIDIEKFSHVPEMIIVTEFTGICNALNEAGYNKATIGRLLAYLTGKNFDYIDGLLTKRIYNTKKANEPLEKYEKNNPYTVQSITAAIDACKKHKINIDFKRLEDILSEIHKNRKQ